MKKETFLEEKILNYKDLNKTSNYDVVASVCADILTQHILQQPIDNRTIESVYRIIPLFKESDINDLNMNVLSKILTQDNLERVLNNMEVHCSNYENSTLSVLCMIMILCNGTYISDFDLFFIKKRNQLKFAVPMFFNNKEVNELIGSMSNKEDVDIANYLSSMFWITEKTQNDLFLKMLKAIK